ncbi:MAG: hypothetical protein RR365_00805 [Bacteroides sp.]
MSKYPKRGEDCEYTEDCMWGTDGWCDRPADYKCVLQKMENEHKAEQKALDEAKKALLKAFPGSFYNQNGEFIAHPRTNQYIIVKDCQTPEDIECKVLEWFSRPAHKTAPYSQEWRNMKFHAFMLDGLNAFLDTAFAEEDAAFIYDYLGNAIRHDKTVEFLEHEMSMEWLREEAPKWRDEA